MPATDNKYERIVAYLKGLLSNRQRHELEKEIMQDAFEEEAFEGLNLLRPEELEADMQILSKRLENRVAHKKIRRMTPLLRIAAGILLLVASGTVIYVLFHVPKKELLTQEESVQESAPKAIQVPEPLENKTEAAVQQDTVSLRSRSTAKRTRPTAGISENRTNKEVVQKQVMDETIANNEPINTEEAGKAAEASAPEAVSQSFSPKLQKTAVLAKPATNLARGNIVDSEGQSLPGVVIKEKGTNRETVSDARGRYSLPLIDTNDILTFSSLGYKSGEKKVRPGIEETIILQEDLTALNEVVVTGYSAQKKDNTTGAISRVKTESEIRDELQSRILIQPVPPGGSLRVFKKWVNDRLDQSILQAYTEKSKIVISLTVHSNGTLGDIKFRDAVPDPVAKEYRRVISQSPPWTPALLNRVAVESQILIRF